MRTKKKTASKTPPPAYPLPPDVTLTSTAQEDWSRLTHLLPLNRGPRLLFVLVDSPVLRRRLLGHLAAALSADGQTVARLDLTAPHYQPLQEIFAAAEAHPQPRFFFLSGLERSLVSPEHRLSALADLNLHRDQIRDRLACPLVVWTTDATLTDLARHTPDFIAWQNGIFTLADPAVAEEAPYRQHLIDRFSKLTLYSATSDAPLAVDLERVFVKLTAMQQRPPVVSSMTSAWESWGHDGEAGLPASAVTHKAAARRAPVSVSSTLERDLVEESSVTLSLTEALQSNRCLTIIGAPGAGKTTLLHFLALTFARLQAAERLDMHEERLPIFVALRDFSRFLDEAARDDPSLHRDPNVLPRFLIKRTQALAPHVQLLPNFFHERLSGGQCIVLLDGLDEVAELRKRARIVEAVAAFTRHYPGNRFVVTSRPRGYEGEAQHQLAALYAGCTIRDFDDADMTAFAHNWYAAVIRDRMGDTPDAHAEAQRQAEDLLHAIRADQRVQALAHNPLLLSVLAMVHQRGVGLPQRRAELYDECTVMLLGYWDQTKGGKAARDLATHGALSRDEKRALLEPIALWFHERGEHSPEATQEELEREIARQFMDLFGDDEDTACSHATLFLQVVDERAGLLVPRETGMYAFAHLTFQEYLAARAIADRDDYIAYTLQRLHLPWWREVLLLEVGHLSDVRHFGRRARRLTSDLIRAIRNADSWLEDVLQRDLLFAVRCLCDTGKLGVDDALRTSLLDELIALWRTTLYEPQRREIAALFAYAMPTPDGVRIHEELLRCLKDSDMRQAAVEALSELGAAAATPAILERLLALLAAPESTVRRAAAGALGGLGAAAATPATLERLRDLTTNPDFGVRQAAAWTLGNMAETTDLVEHLAEFWRNQLANREVKLIGAHLGRVCDIAYRQLQQLAARRDIKIREAQASIPSAL